MRLGSSALALLSSLSLAASCGILPGSGVEITVSVPDSVKPLKDITFYGNNLVDGEPTTAWQTTSGQGKRIKLSLAAPTNMKSIRFQNGHHWLNHPEYGNLWSKNSRIKKASLFINGVFRKTVEFAPDYKEWEEFDLEADNVSTIEIQIDSIYPGWKWNDLAVSEIEIR